ncbi:hypothetical protein VIGAN_05036900 [Vigna angularis var. angularis]|uniref:Uncharacterized protein n=1 Tax=Vigna angularis var. angularis TaxID=157739 RepID=A0A0S3S2I2_PHAAN|nr:hypothetical protein VIGAN_05036900 [Vigna angularis var. angularis]
MKTLHSFKNSSRAFKKNLTMSFEHPLSSSSSSMVCAVVLDFLSAALICASKIYENLLKYLIFFVLIRGPYKCNQKSSLLQAPWQPQEVMGLANTEF